MAMLPINEKQSLMNAKNGDFWVFGYGSLMWRPGFPHRDVRPAVVHGFHRALCVYSHVYRGTPEIPGLVAGLDRGGCCKGLAFLVDGKDREPVMDYLHEREMPTDVYTPKWLSARIDGESIAAYGFVARRDSVQYAGRLSTEETVRLLNQGCGKQGTSLEYLANTVAHMDELGISDGPLHKFLEAARNAG